MTDSSPIHIALASDQRYFPGLLVTAVSIAAYADPKRELSFHILDGGIGSRSLEGLKNQIVGCHARSAFDVISINQANLNGLRSYHGSKMLYGRMMLPELLPDVDSLIYCDVDFLWLADIGKLWNLRDEAALCQGVHDPIITEAVPEIDWIRRHGFPIKASNYICSGLELLNLKAMREEDLSEKLFAFLRDNPDNPQNDQTAVNAICVDRIGMLPENWMRYSFALSDRLPPDVVIHFATYGEVLFGLKKPHPLFIADDAVVLWNRAYKKITGCRIRSYCWARFLFWCIRLARACGITGAAFLRKQRAVFKQPDLGRLK